MSAHMSDFIFNFIDVYFHQCASPQRYHVRICKVSKSKHPIAAARCGKRAEGGNRQEMTQLAGGIPVNFRLCFFFHSQWKGQNDVHGGWQYFSGPIRGGTESSLVGAHPLGLQWICCCCCCCCLSHRYDCKLRIRGFGSGHAASWFGGSVWANTLLLLQTPMRL